MSLNENNILNCEICCVNDDNNNIWFRGKSVAEALGYENTEQAMIDHIKNKYKMKLDEVVRRVSFHDPLTFNDKNTIYISEPGLYFSI